MLVRFRGKQLWAVFLLLVAVVPLRGVGAETAIARFAFTADPQQIQPGDTVNLKLQSQDSAGNEMKLPQTGCIRLDSTSPQGQFSSNAENWSPISVLTMSKNTANRNFYYKDAVVGSYTLSVKIALRPEGESRSCASWPLDEWDIRWTAAQAISIVAGGTVPPPPPPEPDPPPSQPASSPAAVPTPSAAGASSSENQPTEPSSAYPTLNQSTASSVREEESPLPAATATSAIPVVQSVPIRSEQNQPAVSLNRSSVPAAAKKEKETPSADLPGKSGDSGSAEESAATFLPVASAGPSAFFLLATGLSGAASIGFLALKKYF